MNLRASIGATCLLSLAAATSAHADVRGEFGGMAGAHLFGSDNGIGVPDGDNMPSQENSILFGIRFGAYFAHWVGIEAELGEVPTHVRTEDHSTINLFYRLNAVLQFRATDPDHVVIPFVDAGLGGMSLVANPGVTMIEKDTVGEFHFGAGVKLRLDDDWGVRGDVKMLLPPSSNGGYSFDFELALAFYKEWGGAKPASEPAPFVPVVIVPTPPVEEPKPQVVDKDSDNDGFLDSKDTCPNDPEDKDNFQDTDGCPDYDNDVDGIADAKDKCPTDGETKNGFEDDDGCPDTLPAKVQQFTGKVEGINFKTGSADLLASSNKTLDQVVAVLNEYAQLKVEIGGHTDDVPLTAGRNAKYQNNEELSQARAESVKAYLVKKGIAADRIAAKGYGSSVPVEDPAGLTGAKLAAARTKNRRVEFKMQ